MSRQMVTNIAAVLAVLCTSFSSTGQPTGKQTGKAVRHRDNFIACSTSDVLKSVRTVSLLIEDLDKDVTQSGLTKEQIQTDVELRLRETGIRVLDKIDVDVPHLYVDVNCYKSGNTAATSVQLSLQENARLERKPDTVVISATTWSRGAVMLSSTDKLQEGIRSNVKELLDRFLNDYLKANPK